MFHEFSTTCDAPHAYASIVAAVHARGAVPHIPDLDPQALSDDTRWFQLSPGRKYRLRGITLREHELVQYAAAYTVVTKSAEHITRHFVAIKRVPYNHPIWASTAATIDETLERVIDHPVGERPFDLRILWDEVCNSRVSKCFDAETSNR